MKPLLLLVGLLLASGPAVAQAPHMLASPDVMGAPTVAPAALDVANRPSDSGQSSGFGVVSPNNFDVALVGLVTVPVALVEALLLGGWGHKYEQQVIVAWQQQQLPRSIKHRLKPVYFQ